MSSKPLSRRKFLKGAAIVLGGAVVATYAGRGPLRRMASEFAENLDFPSLLDQEEPLFWFELLPDNTLLLRSPKLEMGQGIFTGFAMMAAEELELSPDHIRVIHAPTSSGPVDKLSTGGSNSTSSLYKTIREVSATMREMLRLAAAKHWNVPLETIKAADGQLTSGNKQATYSEIAGITTQWDVPATPPLKQASAFRYIGTHRKRTDLLPKVTGQPVFAIDKTLPGMLYGLILQSPYIGGTLKNVRTEKAVQSPGVVKVIQENGLVAVVAVSRYAAETGLSKIEAEWDVPHKWQQEEFTALTTVGKGTRVNVQNDKSAGKVLQNDKSTLYRQEYRTPMAAHAHMEANGMVMDFKEGKATVLIGTQAPDLVRSAVAGILNIPKKDVNVEMTFAGGGFGRRTDVKQAEDVAKIVKATGRPVHVFNTREQEFMNGIYRPQTHHVLEAGLDKDGNIEAISHQQATADMIFSMAPGNTGAILLGADFVSAGHGSSIIYNIPNKSTDIWHTPLPVKTGIWRSVGIFPNTFATESFINELAHKTQKDPIALRMSLLNGTDSIHKRYQGVLHTLAEKSGWNMPAEKGRGRGVAICNDRKTISAAVAEVEIQDETIVVKKITQVIDPGFAINPEGIRQQVEGATMMTLTAILYEELKVKDGQIATSNFHEYPMVTLADTPEIEVVIVQGTDEIYGVGEPPMGPVAPAVAGALLALTGHALRSLPLRLPA